MSIRRLWLLLTALRRAMRDADLAQHPPTFTPAPLVEGRDYGRGWTSRKGNIVWVKGDQEQAITTLLALTPGRRG